VLSAERATRSPFCGLRPFGDGDDDAALFSGRDGEVKLVSANLQAARLTILYGPSGVGKSSLLRAGAAHRIEAQEAAARAAGKPASRVLAHDEWAGDAAAQLAARVADDAGIDDAPALDEAIRRWGEEHDGVLLLILDQFEEYMRLHPASEGQPLDELLPEVVQDERLRVHVLISLREDALAEMDRFEERMPTIFENVLRLPAMTASAAREAIEQPIATVNAWRVEAGLAAVGVEDGLVGDVLDQLGDPQLAKARQGPAVVGTIEPAFLQLVMRRVWAVDAGREPPLLRRAGLGELGGAAAIVSGHLDAAMQQLTSRQQDVAADVFEHLVTPSGAKIRYAAADLAFYAGRPEGEVAAVLDVLSEPELRIIRRVPSPTGDPGKRGFEIFHDVLAGGVRVWALRMSARRLERRNRRLATAVATLLAVSIALVALIAQPRVMQKAELKLVDVRFALRGDHAPDPRVVIVGIDPARFAPQRGDQARVLAAVARGGPAAIVEATEFEDPGNADNGGPAGTRALVSAVRDASRRLRSSGAPRPCFGDAPAGRVLLGTTRIDSAGNTTLFGEPAPKRRFHGADAGYAGRRLDADDTLRHVLYERSQPAGAGITTGALPGLSALAACLAGERPSRGDFPAWNDVAGGPGTYSHIPFRDVRDGRVDPARFRDRIVVIGSVSSESAAAFRTARDASVPMAPAEWQANEIATMRAGLALRDVPDAVTIALIVAFALLAAALAMRCSTPVAVAGGAGAALLFVVASQLAFQSGWVVAMLPPLIALVVATVANPLIERVAAIGGRSSVMDG